MADAWQSNFFGHRAGGWVGGPLVAVELAGLGLGWGAGLGWWLGWVGGWAGRAGLWAGGGEERDERREKGQREENER